MIDITSEDLIDLRNACGERPLRNPRTGKPCHISALYRYTLHGARAADGRRVRLETIRAPRGLMTSREAIARFIEKLTNPNAEADGVITTVSQRRAQAVVDHELDAAGIC